MRPRPDNRTIIDLRSGGRDGRDAAQLLAVALAALISPVLAKDMVGTPGDDLLNEHQDPTTYKGAVGTVRSSVAKDREGDDVLDGGDARDELFGDEGNDILKWRRW